MSLTLNIRKPFAQEWKRIVCKKLDDTVDILKNATTDEDKHEAVHEARKNFKKIRAALRLVRDNIDFYKDGNVFFRNLGRELAEVRNATSRLETLDLLYTNYNSRIYVNAFADLRKVLEENRKKITGKVWSPEFNLLQSMAERLEAKKQEILAWPLDISEVGDLKSNIRRVYKRGKNRLGDCAKQGEVTDFHQWRKRAKYLRYQLRMLYEAWPELLSTLEDELHTLTNRIGDLHDIHELKEWVSEYQFDFNNLEEKALFEALTEHSCHNLSREAIIRGQRWYHHSSTGFSQKLAYFHKKKIELIEIEE